jgi:hypothetical protein
MKHPYLISFFFYSFVFLHCYAVPHDSSFKDEHEFLLTVVIMVKDEVDVIIPTLKPFVDAGISSFLVYDTGSTDGTQKVIREYFDNHGIEHAYIIEEPFVDFATSRNRALDLTEQIFVNNTFMVMLDAEWYTHNVPELIDYCKFHKNYIAPGCTGSCYLMRLLTVSDNINNYTPRLIRRGHNVRYRGVVHESIANAGSGFVPDSVYFEYRPQQCGKDKSRERCFRDYDLLKKSLEDDPGNLRTLFYLGQTCQFMNDWEQAIFYYQKRLDIGNISEEKYLAAYRIGCAIEHIIAESYKDGSFCKYTEQDAVHYFLQAYSLWPLRVEPLFRIACHYIRHEQHAIAYLFAHRAVQLPHPPQNTLFVENRIYDYLRYDILGQCALYVGEFKIGKEAVLRGLQQEPDDECLHHNLAIYERYLA